MSNPEEAKGRDIKINIKDIHATLWKCRDFELSNLWQRSIFLTAFLVLCFTAYGATLVKLAEKIDGIKTPQLFFFNTISYCLSIIGMIFSILWIKMSKGSKAWYEKYENAIVAFEHNPKYATQEAAKIGGFRQGKIKKYKNPETVQSIWSQKAGSYSVSRINISIGQVFLVLWILIGLAHTILTVCHIESDCISLVVILTGILVQSLFLYWFGRNKMFISDSI